MPVLLYLVGKFEARCAPPVALMKNSIISVAGKTSIKAFFIWLITKCEGGPQISCLSPIEDSNWQICEKMMKKIPLKCKNKEKLSIINKCHVFFLEKQYLFLLRFFVGLVFVCFGSSGFCILLIDQKLRWWKRNLLDGGNEPLMTTCSGPVGSVP